MVFWKYLFSVEIIGWCLLRWGSFKAGKKASNIIIPLNCINIEAWKLKSAITMAVFPVKDFILCMFHLLFIKQYDQFQNINLRQIWFPFWSAEGSACHVEVDGHLTPNVRDYLSIHEQVYDPNRTWMNITFDLGVMLVSALLFSPRSPHCDASTIFF